MWQQSRQSLQQSSENSNVARRISLDDDEFDSEESNSPSDFSQTVEVVDRAAIDEGTTIADALAEMNESGAGGDSDDEDENFLHDIQAAAADVWMYRMNELNGDEAAVLEEGNEMEVQNAGSNLEGGNRNERDSEDENENENENIEDDFEIRKLYRQFGPQIPADWQPPRVRVEKGQPRSFVSIDNPGEWDEYCFRPKFQPKNPRKYLHHSLPTGVIPVPTESRDSEKRIDGEWEFYYRGWEGTERRRDGADRHNLFPAERKGSLDGDLLKTMGLTKERMVECDALFFHQLLLPMCRIQKSGIEGDLREDYYDKVENFSNLYAFTELKLGSSYGHSFKNFSIPELIHFDGVVVRDGVKGGSNGAIYRRWIADGSDCDEFVMNSLTFTRWLQIKRAIKINDNSTAIKKGEEGYDPAYKYDFIWRVLFHNINAMTKNADLDQCGDETSWGHAGYSDVTSKIHNKPNVSKGGQTVITCDVGRNYPRVYCHRHNYMDHPDGVTAKGQAEVINVARQIEKMVMAEEGEGAEEPVTEGKKIIFKAKPCFTFDNFFSGECSLNYLGSKGFAGIFTCARNRLPKGVKKHFFHHVKTDTSLKTKVARFFEPVVAVKKFEPSNGNEYERVHVSFQSTSSCNISTVNALSSCSFFTREKKRGVGKNVRKWHIEMNEARQLYLKSYFRVDNLDAALQKCNMYYRSWKYWHMAMLHAKKIAIATSYAMYKEACEGNLNPDWKIENPVSFWEWRDKLSKQMLQYDPADQLYPGDELFRAVTSLPKKKRKSSSNGPGRPSKKSKEKSPVFVDKVDLCVEIEKDEKDRRLCGDLTCFSSHVLSTRKMKNGGICAWCGIRSFTKCEKCGKYLHFFPQRGKVDHKVNCFANFHDDSKFGLSRVDQPLLGKKKADWKDPSGSKQKRNRKHISNLKNEL